MSVTDDLLKRLDFLELEQDRQGYVVLLEFADAPVSEWSDETNGWRSKNLGSRYTSIQLADKKLAILKQKWPDYPLRIGLIT
jgi:hypothetical protein